MLAIIDYGVGNLFSLSSSLKSIGADTIITGDIEIIKKADKLILPGVGAFCDAITKLKEDDAANRKDNSRSEEEFLAMLGCKC